MFVPLTPLRCLHRALDLFGAKTGIVSGSLTFTYAQFGERCERLAAGLTRLGVGAGDRVAYLSYNNHQLLEGYYGVIQAHAIVMPLNVRLSRGELSAILQHSGARVARSLALQPLDPVPYSRVPLMIRCLPRLRIIHRTTRVP